MKTRKKEEKVSIRVRAAKGTPVDGAERKGNLGSRSRYPSHLGRKVPSRKKEREVVFLGNQWPPALPDRTGSQARDGPGGIGGAGGDPRHRRLPAIRGDRQRQPGLEGERKGGNTEYRPTKKRNFRAELEIPLGETKASAM